MAGTSIGKLMGDQKPGCELTVKGGRVIWDVNGISRPLWTEMGGHHNDAPNRVDALTGRLKLV